MTFKFQCDIVSPVAWLIKLLCQLPFSLPLPSHCVFSHSRLKYNFIYIYIYIGGITLQHDVYGYRTQISLAILLRNRKTWTLYLCHKSLKSHIPWRRHGIETLSVLVALLLWESTGRRWIPHKEPLMRSFHVFFIACLNIHPVHSRPVSFNKQQIRFRLGSWG